MVQGNRNGSSLRELKGEVEIGIGVFTQLFFKLNSYQTLKNIYENSLGAIFYSPEGKSSRFGSLDTLESHFNNFRNVIDQPGYPNSTPQPGYPNIKPQPGYPNTIPQPGYPNIIPQPGYPNTIPQPGYPNTTPQPGYPNTIPQPGYPNTIPQPGYPNIIPQPGYPNIKPQPGYPNTIPQPGYPNTIPQPGYPNIKPQPGYPNTIPQPATIFASLMNYFFTFSILFYFILLYHISYQLQLDLGFTLLQTICCTVLSHDYDLLTIYHIVFRNSYLFC